MLFENLRTGQYFMHRGRRYMKCSNSISDFDTEFNAWLVSKWPLKEGERYFRSNTKVRTLKKKQEN